MKTVVFFMGTNCVGKSTIAWGMIERFGGLGGEGDGFVYCANKRYGLAGKYCANKRYGGVDRLTNDKGTSCTSRLAEVVENALSLCDVVFCEGSYVNTFGLNLTNALFKGQRQLFLPFERASSRS